jgi:hypothetical protein
MTIIEILSIVSTSIGILTVLGKVFIVAPLKNLIREQTRPIQPNANGGRSLPDVARATIEIKASLEALTNQIDRVEGRLDTHIEQHIQGGM